LNPRHAEYFNTLRQTDVKVLAWEAYGYRRPARRLDDVIQAVNVNFEPVIEAEAEAEAWETWEKFSRMEMGVEVVDVVVADVEAHVASP
jgi:hypothetical protein